MVAFEIAFPFRGIEEELTKQESLLKCLHADLAAEGEDERKTEELWDVVRIITQLKREVGPSFLFAFKLTREIECPRLDPPSIDVKSRVCPNFDFVL